MSTGTDRNSTIRPARPTFAGTDFKGVSDSLGVRSDDAIVETHRFACAAGAGRDPSASSDEVETASWPTWALGFVTCSITSSTRSPGRIGIRVTRLMTAPLSPADPTPPGAEACVVRSVMVPLAENLVPGGATRVMEPLPAARAPFAEATNVSRVGHGRCAGRIARLGARAEGHRGGRPRQHRDAHRGDVGGGVDRDHLTTGNRGQRDILDR